MQPQLTLYHYWRSSCSWRVRWALNLKGLKYQSVIVNLLNGENESSQYRQISPAGYVPSLQISVDGKTESFGESLAIIEWLDEQWPTPPLLPTDPLDRMRSRQLALAVVAGIQPLQNPLVLKRFVPQAEEREGHIRFFIERGMRVYEEVLRSRRQGVYSVGDSVTIADLCLVPQVYNAYRFAVSMDPFPLCREIYHRCIRQEACDLAAPYRQIDAPPDAKPLP